jgi:hypothetical protein
MTWGRRLSGGAFLLALALPAVAAAQPQAGTAAGLRAAATRVIQAELARDGAGVCAVLYAPLTSTVDGRPCAQRWDRRAAAELRSPGRRARLRRDLRAVESASVRIVGEHGTIALPAPLLDGHSRFYWTANCWMLTR